MSISLTLTSQQFQSLVSNHPAALVELGLLPQAQVQQVVAAPEPVAKTPDYTEFIDLMVDIFDGPPEDLQRLREHITSALKGKKVEKKWDLEFEACAAEIPVGGSVAAPEEVLEPVAMASPAPVPVSDALRQPLPESPNMAPVSRKTLSQAHLDRMKAGRAAKKARIGYRLAAPSECAMIVAEIDAGTRVSPTPSVSWKKGQAHHPNNPSVKNVIAVMANGGEMSEKQITVNSSLKASRVRIILRELERQGIAVPF